MGVGGITRRASAFVLDVLLLLVVLGPIGWGVQRLAHLRPETGPEIWHALILNFSAPVWAYFIILDSASRGGTIGKRILGLRVVVERDGGRVPVSRIALRTLLKLTPWEIVHVSVFALSEDMARLTSLQVAGLAFGNILALSYLVVAFATDGRRSIHDFAAGTAVVGAAA